MLITGFLRMTWMNKKHMAGIMADHLKDISKEDLIMTAKAIRAPMWEWHEIFAYVVFAVFTLRIIYMLVKGIRFPNPFAKEVYWLERLQGLTYIVFYLFVAFSIYSGSMLEWAEKTEYVKKLEAIHKLGLYFYPAFIVIHLLGVYIEEKTKKNRITSKMIGGE